MPPSSTPSVCDAPSRSSDRRSSSSASCSPPGRHRAGQLPRELARLQDGAGGSPVDDQHAAGAGAGAPPEDIFATFEGVPLACASIGQAHLATLHDGSQVVVKIRRPDIQALIDTDLDILQNLASRASRRWSRRRELQPGRSGRGVRGVAPPGLDYLTEGRNAERFAANFAEHPDVHIPGALGDDDVSGADPGAHRRYQGRRPGRARPRSGQSPDLGDEGCWRGGPHGLRARLLPRRSASGQPVHRAGRSDRADRLRDGGRDRRRASASARRVAGRPHRPRRGEAGEGAAGSLGGEATSRPRAVPVRPRRVHVPLPRPASGRGQCRQAGDPAARAAASTGSSCPRRWPPSCASS